MNIGIKIMPREVILDSQGRALESSMKSNGFVLESIRAGKYLEIILPEKNPELAKKEVEKMLKDGGLYNPLIENYEIYLL